MSLLSRLGGQQKTVQPRPAAPRPAAPVGGEAAPAVPPQPAVPARAPGAAPAVPVPATAAHGESSEVAVVMPPHWERLTEHRRALVNEITAGIEAGLEMKRTPKTMKTITDRFMAAYQRHNLQLEEADQKNLFEMIVSEIVGFGPIQAALDDPTVSEVMVNGPNLTYIEKKGKLVETDIKFDDDDHVMRVVDRIVRPLGRRVDRKVPMVDARLPDGSRVNVIIPPSALNGPTITIRKFPSKRPVIQDLINFGSFTPQMAEFFKACVISRLNIVVAGGTGSGKTTLLNVLSSLIPEDERIVTIEDSAELQLQQKHVVRLEAKPAELDGTGAVSIRDLVKNSLRMRPERIVIGECRGPETLDMLQAMNTGHDGSLTTLHSNTPREATSRMETLSLMAGIAFPIHVIREQISGAIDLIIQQSRLSDGSRRVTYVTEVAGMEGEVIVLQDIFKYTETGRNQDGKVLGEMRPTGLRPKFSDRLEAYGFKLSGDIFGADTGSPRRY
jgi:pilus assembly protein CpaF